jgi:hypothetical protein
MKITRRTAVGLATALWMQAQEHSHPAAEKAAPQTLRFLTAGEVKTLLRYASVLLPATERSGGAAAAGVEFYTDRVLQAAAQSLQRLWRRGLADWEGQKDAEATLTQLAVNEFSPKTAGEQFFVIFKNAMVAAFYTSEEGIRKELGYQGLGFVRDFRGYQGEEFVVPKGYVPQLKVRS